MALSATLLNDLFQWQAVCFLRYAENKMQTLIIKMTESGEADKLAMLSDKAFLEEMYRKYGM